MLVVGPDGCGKSTLARSLIDETEGEAKFGEVQAISLATPAAMSLSVERLIGVDAAGAGWAVDSEGLGPLPRRLEGERREQLERRCFAALELSRRYDWESMSDQFESICQRIGS